MFQPLGQDAKCQDFGLGHGFVGSGAVRKHAGQLRYFSQPTAIFLKFTFNIEIHDIPLRMDNWILRLAAFRCLTRNGHPNADAK